MNCIFFRIQVELYDVETGFVRELPSMGRNRSYHACGVAQSKVLNFFRKKTPISITLPTAYE